MNTRGFVGSVVLCLVLAACTTASDDTAEPETTTTAAEIQSSEASTSSATPETTSSVSSTIGATDEPDSATVATKTSLPAEWESVLPSDMHCEDFVEMDLTYEAALGYWFVSGRPDRMDTDGNDIPCDEAVYSVRLPVVGEGEDAWFAHGLYCRDIVTVLGWGQMCRSSTGSWKAPRIAWTRIVTGFHARARGSKTSSGISSR